MMAMFRMSSLVTVPPLLVAGVAVAAGASAAAAQGVHVTC